MSDLRYLAQRLWVSEGRARCILWEYVAEEVIPPPERGERGKIILNEETIQAIEETYKQRRKETSSVASLAVELYRTPGAILSVIRGLIERGVFPPPIPPKKVRGKTRLTSSQIDAVRGYYRSIKMEAPVNTLAKELGVSPRRMRRRIKRLMKKSEIPSPEKTRRGNRTILLLTQQMKKKIRRSFAEEKGAD